MMLISETTGDFKLGHLVNIGYDRLFTVVL